MGIDIYAKWKNQSKEEEKQQYTGFSIVSGNVGYLREAYHGGPYATHYFVSEAFEEGEAKIPAATLKERLPATVLLSMFRQNKLYGKDKKPNERDITEMPAVLKEAFANMKDDSHESIVKGFLPETLQHAKTLIESRILPDYALTYVEFADLCEKKEKETGEPVNIIASY